MILIMKCDSCAGTGLVDGHGHVPGSADYQGREHVCEACPVPCSDCQGRGEIERVVD